MTAAVAAGQSVRDILRSFAPHWPLLVGLLLVAVPTCVTLAEQIWSYEAGAHGPIVLATGLWLITRCWNEMSLRKSPSSAALATIWFVGALALYTFGRAYDFISLEALGLYLTGMATVYSLVGWSGLRVAGFPLLYLFFLVPIPGWVLDYATSPLREFVSHVATSGLRHLGYPIINQGVVIYIAGYQLLVEDACSGMNSIVGLTAIALFYIHIMGHSSVRHAMALVLLVIPVAIVVNLIRVVTLILLTYYAGDGVAQGFMHVTTGIVLFAFALLLMFATDAVLRWLLGHGKHVGHA